MAWFGFGNKEEHFVRHSLWQKPHVLAPRANLAHVILAFSVHTSQTHLTRRDVRVSSLICWSLYKWITLQFAFSPDHTSRTLMCLYPPWAVLPAFRAVFHLWDFRPRAPNPCCGQQPARSCAVHVRGGPPVPALSFPACAGPGLSAQTEQAAGSHYLLAGLLCQTVSLGLPLSTVTL